MPFYEHNSVLKPCEQNAILAHSCRRPVRCRGRGSGDERDWVLLGRGCGAREEMSLKLLHQQ